MISIQNLTFRYQHSPFDLKIPDLAISAGQATAIVGPSGSGKTTLLHLMAGILTPVQGRIQIGQTPVSELSDSGRRNFRLSNIGLIFQDFELIEYLTVLDNVLLPCRIGKLQENLTDARRQAINLLEHAGLKAHLAKSVTRLSQGERQRVAICRALVTRPPLLLADEPTGNLDPTTTQQIMDLLLASVSRQNSTLVMVTHDHSLLNRFHHLIDFHQFLTEAPDTEALANMAVGHTVKAQAADDNHTDGASA